MSLHGDRLGLRSRVHAPGTRSGAAGDEAVEKHHAIEGGRQTLGNLAATRASWPWSRSARSRRSG